MAFKSSGCRTVIAIAVILMLFSVWFCPTLTAQTATTPVVPSQAVAMVSSSWAQSNTTETQIWKIKRAPKHGDLIAWDGQSASLYQFPADGSGVKIIVPKRPNVFGGDQWTTGGFTFDKDDNLYISNRWTGYSVKVPYNEEQKTWIFVINDSTKWAYMAAPNADGGATWFSASDIDYVENDATGNGNFFIGDETGAKQIFQFKGTGVGKSIVRALKNRPMRVSVDKAGNVYFTEDWGQTGVKGVFRIPRGVYGLAGNNDGVMEQSWPKCGPDAFDASHRELPCQVDDGTIGAIANARGMNGVSVDADGNVYLGDQDDFNSSDATNKMTGGIFKVPLETYYASDGTTVIGSMPNAAHQMLIAPIPAQGNIEIDPSGDLYIPLWAANGSGGGGWNGFFSFIKVHLGSAALPPATLGVEGSTAQVMFSFNSSVAPDLFSFSQAGKDAVDFVKAADPTVGACTGSFTRYQRCTVNVALNPGVVGSISGVLTMEAGGNVVSTAYVHGVGQGPALSILSSPAITALRSGLVAPKQVATDRWGNFYVADAGSGKVLQYPRGSSDSTAPTEIGKGFTAPTGVVVDGAGNVFVADSGKVFEISVSGGDPFIVQTGLGTNLSLGADGAGNVYAADPDKQRVIRVANPAARLAAGTGIVTVGSGFTAPTAVAADDAGNVFVVDGQTLTEVLPSLGQTPLTNELASPVGVALDASGAVYVAQADGAIRIPKIAGALDYTQKTMIGSDFVMPNSVAVDPNGTVYITDGETPSVIAIGTAGAADFAFVTMNQTATQTVTMFNIGNSDLTFGSPVYVSTGGSDAFRLAPTGDHCSGAAVVPGLTCNVDFTMTPTGAPGAVQATGNIQSNAGNGTVALTLLGVGSDSAPSKITAITYTPTNPVYPENVTIFVTVAAADGGGVPTGKAYLTVDGQRTKLSILTDGVAQFTLKKPNGGPHTIIATYQGDMNYASASLTLELTIGRADTTTALANPPKPPGIPDYYVLYQGGYNLQAKVTSTAGLPTGTVMFQEGATQLGTGVLDANGNATFNTNTLPLGWHMVTAVYSGDPNFKGSSSTQIKFLILNPSVAITTDTPNLTLKAGVAGGVTVNLIPVVTYNRQVQLACVNVPQYSECTFDSPTVNLKDGNIVPVQVLISTNVPVNIGAARPNARPGSGWWFATATFAIGLVGLGFGKKTRYNGRALIIVCALLIITSATVGLTACSGSGYTKTPPAPHVTTPTGMQVVTITATDTTTHTIVSLPFQLNVTVQQ